MNKDKLQNHQMDKTFLKNIGVHKATHNLMHLKSKNLRNRYRDTTCIKDLDSKIWSEPYTR